MSIGEKEDVSATAALRAELKKWENVFREANGRKPARADIKADATIGKSSIDVWGLSRVLRSGEAAKYKLFDRLAGRKAADPPPPPPPAATPKKSTRHAEPKQKPKVTVSSTPRKTHSEAHHHTTRPSVLSPVQEQEIEPTPAFIRNALGPTPQKDGQVLGIFDIDTGPTPSKVESATALGPEGIVAGTPCKAAAHTSDPGFSKTPQSMSKRFYLDAFAGTPLKRKRDKDDVGTTSSSKRRFATPAFLRRSFPMASIDEESTETTSTSRQPFGKRGLVRSLSSIMNNLKKQEEERMDEEWDILNEIEEEERQPKKKEASKVMIEDSQPVEMPLGPDQAPESQGEESNAEEGTSRKPWKKKGLKRQTRRVIMRPVFHKAKKAEDDDQSHDEERDVIPETQLETGGDENAADGSDYDDELGEGGAMTTKKSKGKQKEKVKPDQKEGGKMKVRKVNPDAHANFRKLKIKNKNSKANGRGRFGRR